MMRRLLRRTSAQPVRRVKRKRFRFSLNGLAIQLSAFALSFTLVALLVVTGSKAAFVEESEVLADYVPIGTAAPSSPVDGRRPSRPAVPTPAETPTVEEPPVLLVDEPIEEVEEPVEEELPEVVELPEIEVELSDSDAGTAMFGGETLLPGDPLDRCIEVNYSGDDNPRPVKLFAAATSGALAPYLDLTIDMGSAAAGAFGSCGSFSGSTTVYSGTLDSFASTHSSYSTGLSTWSPSATQETRSFRFRLTVQDVPAAAGKTVTFGFTWRTEES